MELTKEQKDQIETRVRALFRPEYGDGESGANITVEGSLCSSHGDRHECIKITVEKMYYKPDVRVGTLELLQGISEATGMKDVNTEEICEPGCETCDYGSSYGYEFYCFNPVAIDNQQEILEGISQGEKDLAAGNTVDWETAKDSMREAVLIGRKKS